MAAKKKRKSATKAPPARPAVRKRKVAKPAKPAKRGARNTSTRADALSRERARLERNKQLVLAFYAKMIGEKDPEAARAFMGPTYTQHSFYAPDGFEGVAAFARDFKRDFPGHAYSVKRVIAEGDYVVLHLHGTNGPNPHGEAVIDIFRVKGDKVVEHWDVIQALPETFLNANGPF